MCMPVTAYPINHLLDRESSVLWREMTRNTTHSWFVVLPRRWYPDYIWNVVGTYAAKLGDNLVRLSYECVSQENEIFLGSAAGVSC
jgi:hypothetical protein